MKQLNFLIGALILGLSIVFSSFVIKDAVSKTASTKANALSETANLKSNFPDLMTKKQLSKYLQVSEKSIDHIINSDKLKKSKMIGGYDTYQFLPYLKIDNQERFLKTEVDQWLKYKSENN